MKSIEAIQETANYLRNRGVKNIDVAIVLGTGLTVLKDLLQTEEVIDYSDIPFFPVSTVESHAGKMFYGKFNDKDILIIAGRFHYYEGYEMDDVTYYVHVLKALNAKQLIITNAAGGLNPHFQSGDIVVVNDHINLFPVNPLRGRNDDHYGARFPDMMKVYQIELIEQFKAAAQQSNIGIKEGVYLGWQGPSLETPAEYKMARMLGADLVGMSSVPEAIVAKYCKIPLLMLSIVSNQCFPLSEIKEVTIEEIIHCVNASAEKLKGLLKAFLSQK